MQQWVGVMRKAGCVIHYTPNLMDESKPLAYIARCKVTQLPVGFWFAEDNSGSIAINGKIIMTLELAG